MNVQVRPIENLSLEELLAVRDEQGENVSEAITQAIQNKRAAAQEEVATVVPTPISAALAPKPIC